MKGGPNQPVSFSLPHSRGEHKMEDPEVHYSPAQSRKQPIEEAIVGL